MNCMVLCVLVSPSEKWGQTIASLILWGLNKLHIRLKTVPSAQLLLYKHCLLLVTLAFIFHDLISNSIDTEDPGHPPWPYSRSVHDLAPIFSVVVFPSFGGKKKGGLEIVFQFQQNSLVCLNDVVKNNDTQGQPGSPPRLRKSTGLWTVVSTHLNSCSSVRRFPLPQNV